jgi:hypothetical protein
VHRERDSPIIIISLMTISKKSISSDTHRAEETKKDINLECWMGNGWRNVTFIERWANLGSLSVWDRVWDCWMCVDTSTILYVRVQETVIIRLSLITWSAVCKKRTNVYRWKKRSAPSLLLPFSHLFETWFSLTIPTISSKSVSFSSSVPRLEVSLLF